MSKDELTHILVKLELLRGACQMHKGPSRKSIAQSIETLIASLQKQYGEPK